MDNTLEHLPPDVQEMLKGAGITTVKLVASVRIKEVDLAAPAYIQGTLAARITRELGAGGVGPAAISRIIIPAVVGAAFPQGIERRDAQMWAVWQEALDREEPVIRIPWTHVEWMRKLADRDEVRLPPAFAQWREAWCAYLAPLTAPEQMPPALPDPTRKDAS